MPAFTELALLPVEASMPLAEPEAEVEAEVEAAAEADDVIIDDLPADAGLYDCLAAARELARAADSTEDRSRSALYAAVGRAWDFALAAESQPDAFAEMLDDAGLKAQDRAPMTPVVKLVFGATYDKTRLAEYACVLGHAREAGVERGGLTAYLDRYPGGLKALVRDERGRKRSGDAVETPANRADAQLDSLRALAPAMMLPIAGDQEFVILVARRVDADHVGLVASVDADGAAWSKMLAKAVPLA
ncbi:MAG: hypothetical protein HC794_09635 [Nitrospiraceae bacterium]|nr:hypothetical protein [Nitrospiraceae bacterium]